MQSAVAKKINDTVNLYIGGKGLPAILRECARELVEPVPYKDEKQAADLFKVMVAVIVEQAVTDPSVSDEARPGAILIGTMSVFSAFRKNPGGVLSGMVEVARASQGAYARTNAGVLTKALEQLGAS